eukprot:3353771-Prymnesium_polylepis.1
MAATRAASLTSSTGRSLSRNCTSRLCAGRIATGSDAAAAFSAEAVLSKCEAHRSGSSVGVLAATPLDAAAPSSGFKSDAAGSCSVTKTAARHTLAALSTAPAPSVASSAIARSSRPQPRWSLTPISLSLTPMPLVPSASEEALAGVLPRLPPMAHVNAAAIESRIPCCGAN